MWITTHHTLFTLYMLTHSLLNSNDLILDKNLDYVNIANFKYFKDNE